MQMKMLSSCNNKQTQIFKLEFVNSSSVIDVKLVNLVAKFTLFNLLNKNTSKMNRFGLIFLTFSCVFDSNLVHTIDNAVMESNGLIRLIKNLTNIRCAVLSSNLVFVILVFM